MKKIIIGIIVVLLVAMAVPVAYAAVNSLSPEKQKEVDALNKQIFDLRKKVIDKNVEGGLVTPDQGKLAKDRLDQAQKYWQENGGKVTPGYGRGACGGPGVGCNPGACPNPGGGFGPGAGYGARGGATPNSF